MSTTPPTPTEEFGGKPSARRARSGDKGALSRLLDDARSSVAERRGGAHYIASISAERGGVIGPEPMSEVRLAGVLGHDVVGVANVSPVIPASSSGASEEGWLTVSALFVLPAARRQGVGTALLGAIERLALESGLRGVDVSALPGDQAMKSFLESQGYRARLLVLYRDLP